MIKLITYYWRSLRSRLSILKLVSGMLVALLMSFVVYSFSCVMLEVFRITTVTPEYDMWMLGDKERSFYQLFFAFVSVILAQSFCLAYWFDGPRHFFEKGHRSAVRIVNGQRNLNWYFLSWFAKVVFCWFVIFSIPGGFYAFSLYPDYNCVFILLIIVLFLHPWVAMRLAFKRKTLKWMALSALLVSALAFGMSRINLVDYESLENAFLSRNVAHVYGLDFPVTNAAQKTERANLTKDVYMVQSNDAEPKCLIFVDGQKVDLQKFSRVMEEWRSCYNEADIPLLSCRLNIDKSLKMKDVDEVRQVLADMQFYRIQYAVIPKNPEIDIRYYTFLSMPSRMPIRFVDSLSYQETLDRLCDESSHQINVSQNTLRDYLINGVPVSGEDCKRVLKRLMQQNPDYVIRFNVDGEMLYGDYMVILTSAFEALNELKDEYAMEKYSKHLEQVCSDEEVKDINEHFPFRFFEKK